jgi:hypothetical protein
LRRARAAPSARLGFLIRVRQHAIFQGRRCGQDTRSLRNSVQEMAEGAQMLLLTLSGAAVASRSPVHDVTIRIANTAYGATGGNFRIARQQELTFWQNASAIKVNHLKSMNKSDVLDVTIQINQLGG